MSAEAVLADIAHFWDRPAYHRFLHKMSPDLRARAICAIARLAIKTDAGRRASIALLQARLARGQKIPHRGDALVYAPTANNVRALAPLLKMLGNLGLTSATQSATGAPIGHAATPQIIVHHSPPQPVPSRSDLSRLLAGWRSADGFVALQLLHGLAAYAYFLRILSAHPCRVILLSNDHSPVPVALRHAANALGRRVIYRQHAPVSMAYPPLDCELAVLMDTASADIYRQIAAKLHAPFAQRARVVILPPFYEAAQKIRQPVRVDRWLILLSRVWNRDGLEAGILQLLSRPDTKTIALRLHPADRRDPLAIMGLHDPRLSVLPEGRSMSKAAAEADVALVGATGAALETLRLGLPTVYCDGLDDLPPDAHGLIAAGILLKISRHDLAAFSADRTKWFDSSWRKRFSNYDPTADTALQTLVIDTRATLADVLGMSDVAAVRETTSGLNPLEQEEFSVELANPGWMSFNLPQNTASKKGNVT